MTGTVRRTVRRYQMLPAHGRVLCCLSGGADSVALLLVLRELGAEVCACHLNHQLRGEESEQDERFCEALCQRLEVPFFRARASIRPRAHVSLETAARETRYAFFERAAQHFGAVRIATAHTAEDNLETMLFHLARGSGAAGLAGIPPVRGRFIRPLIECERAQIEAYLVRYGQNWRTDSTNLTDDYTRNRIRHAVVPVLREICPSAVRNASHAAELLRQDHVWLEEQARQLSVECEALRAAPQVLRLRKVRQLMKQASVPMGQVGSRQMQAAEQLIRTGRGQLSLPGNFVLCWRNRRLTVVPRARIPQSCPLRLEQPVVFGAFVILAQKTDEQTREVFNNSFNKFVLRYDTIDLETFTVRTWKATDRIQLPGARGARSLKRLYAERGVAPEERDRIPVLCDRYGVIAAYALGCDVSRTGDVYDMTLIIQQN